MSLQRRLSSVFSNADAKNARWSWLRRSLYALMLLSLPYFAYLALFSRNSIHHSLLQRPFCEHPPAPAAAAEAARSPTTLAHIVFVIGASKTTWAKRGVYTSLWWRPGAMRGHVWLDGEPSGPWHQSWPPYRVLRPNAARFGREHAAAARMAQAVAEAYHATAAAAVGLEEGAGSGEARWLVMGDDDTVFFPENLAAVLDRYDHREMYYVGSSSESVGQNVAHSYAMAFGGGGYAISFPAAAALAGIMDGCLDRYNELYGSDHRVQACLSELGVPLTREPGFHQLDLKGHVYGLLAAHPVAPLVSLHHLDRLNPISPNSLKRLHAVRSLVGASRRDPARTLQQSICYYRSRSRPRGTVTLSVSVSWGYMVHLYPSAVPPHELQTPLRTFRAWSGSPAGPFTVNTRPEAAANATALPCHRRPVMFYLDRVTTEESLGSAGQKQNRTLTEYVPELVSSDACNGTGFDAVAKVQTIRVLALKMDPAVSKRAPRRQCCKVESSKEDDSLVVEIYECKPNEVMRQH